jgi:hypothetical protein
MYWPPMPIVVVLVTAICLMILPKKLSKRGEEIKSFAEAMIPPSMQVLISLALLGASLYVILSRDYQQPQQNWAYGMVGTIAGFWLKGAAQGKKRG